VHCLKKGLSVRHADAYGYDSIDTRLNADHCETSKIDRTFD